MYKIPIQDSPKAYEDVPKIKQAFPRTGYLINSAAVAFPALVGGRLTELTTWGALFGVATSPYSGLYSLCDASSTVSSCNTPVSLIPLKLSLYEALVHSNTILFTPSLRVMSL